MNRTPTAGGCLLITPILIGFAAGIATGDAMRGVLLGTALGLALAVGHWLYERNRPSA